MIKADMSEFRTMLDQCARVLGGEWVDAAGTKLSRPDDETVETYWQALKDLPFEQVRRAVQSHLKRGKWFPKPFQLRPKDDSDKPQLSMAARNSAHAALLELAQREPGKYGYHKPAIAFNEQTWREFKARDPELYEIEIGIAHCGRVLSFDLPSSPQYEDAVREDRRFRDARRELMERRRLEAHA